MASTELSGWRSNRGRDQAAETAIEAERQTDTHSTHTQTHVKKRRKEKEKN